MTLMINLRMRADRKARLLCVAAVDWPDHRPVRGLGGHGTAFVAAHRRAVPRLGWRVAFLISAVRACGPYIRLNIQETPEFAAIKANNAALRTPFVDMIKRYPGNILKGMGARYIGGAFVIGYLANTIKISRTDALLGVMVAALVMIVTIPIFGHLSDRIGRPRVYAWGSIITAVSSYPAFWLMTHSGGNVLIIWLAIVIPFGILYAFIYGPDMRRRSSATSSMPTGDAPASRSSNRSPASSHRASRPSSPPRCSARTAASRGRSVPTVLFAEQRAAELRRAAGHRLGSVRSDDRLRPATRREARGRLRRPPGDVERRRRPVPQVSAEVFRFGKSSSWCSCVWRLPPACCAASVARSSTRLILPEIVFGSSVTNSILRTRL